MPWSVDHGPSSVSPSATFNIFDISIRIISMMAAMPNSKSNGGVAWRFRIAKMVQMATMTAILKIIKSHLFPNGKSD